MQRSAFCRSRREFANDYLLAKYGFNTAENEPCKVCPLSPYRSPRSRRWRKPLAGKPRAELLVGSFHSLPEPHSCGSGCALAPMPLLLPPPVAQPGVQSAMNLRDFPKVRWPGWLLQWRIAAGFEFSSFFSYGQLYSLFSRRSPLLSCPRYPPANSQFRGTSAASQRLLMFRFEGCSHCS